MPSAGALSPASTVQISGSSPSSFQIRSNGLSEPVASILPSGAICTANGRCLCPERLTRTLGLPPNTSQKTARVSLLPVTNVLPSGVNARPLGLASSLALCVGSVCVTSQSVTVLSQLDEASRLPSGENAS